MFGLALTYWSLERKEEADSSLAALIQRFQVDSAYQVASVYAYRGERDKAFEWLERAHANRDGGMAGIKRDPFLRNIQRDPRYAALLKKMRLPLSD